MLMNPKRLDEDEQIAWISGGASGMGEASAKLFAAESASPHGEMQFYSIDRQGALK